MIEEEDYCTDVDIDTGVMMMCVEREEDDKESRWERDKHLQYLPDHLLFGHSKRAVDHSDRPPRKHASSKDTPEEVSAAEGEPEEVREEVYRPAWVLLSRDLPRASSERILKQLKEALPGRFVLVDLPEDMSSGDPSHDDEASAAAVTKRKRRVKTTFQQYLLSLQRALVAHKHIISFCAPGLTRMTRATFVTTLSALLQCLSPRPSVHLLVSDELNSGAGTLTALHATHGALHDTYNKHYLHVRSLLQRECGAEVQQLQRMPSPLDREIKRVLQQMALLRVRLRHDALLSAACKVVYAFEPDRRVCPSPGLAVVLEALYLLLDAHNGTHDRTGPLPSKGSAGESSSAQSYVQNYSSEGIYLPETPSKSSLSSTWRLTRHLLASPQVLADQLQDLKRGSFCSSSSSSSSSSSTSSTAFRPQRVLAHIVAHYVGGEVWPQKGQVFRASADVSSVQSRNSNSDKSVGGFRSQRLASDTSSFPLSETAQAHFAVVPAHAVQYQRPAEEPSAHDLRLQMPLERAIQLVTEHLAQYVQCLCSSEQLTLAGGGVSASMTSLKTSFGTSAHASSSVGAIVTVCDGTVSRPVSRPHFRGGAGHSVLAEQATMQVLRGVLQDCRVLRTVSTLSTMSPPALTLQRHSSDSHVNSVGGNAAQRRYGISIYRTQDRLFVEANDSDSSYSYFTYIALWDLPMLLMPGHADTAPDSSSSSSTHQKKKRAATETSTIGPPSSTAELYQRLLQLLRFETLPGIQTTSSPSNTPSPSVATDPAVASAAGAVGLRRHMEHGVDDHGAVSSASHAHASVESVKLKRLVCCRPFRLLHACVRRLQGHVAQIRIYLGAPGDLKITCYLPLLKCAVLQYDFNVSNRRTWALHLLDLYRCASEEAPPVRVSVRRGGREEVCEEVDETALEYQLLLSTAHQVEDVLLAPRKFDYSTLKNDDDEDEDGLDKDNERDRRFTDKDRESLAATAQSQSPRTSADISQLIPFLLDRLHIHPPLRFLDRAPSPSSSAAEVRLSLRLAGSAGHVLYRRVVSVCSLPRLVLQVKTLSHTQKLWISVYEPRSRHTFGLYLSAFHRHALLGSTSPTAAMDARCARGGDASSHSAERPLTWQRLLESRLRLHLFAPHEVVDAGSGGGRGGVRGGVRQQRASPSQHLRETLSFGALSFDDCVFRGALCVDKKRYVLSIHATDAETCTLTLYEAQSSVFFDCLVSPADLRALVDSQSAAEIAQQSSLRQGGLQGSGDARVARNLDFMRAAAEDAGTGGRGGVRGGAREAGGARRCDCCYVHSLCHDRARMQQLCRKLSWYLSAEPGGDAKGSANVHGAIHVPSELRTQTPPCAVSLVFKRRATAHNVHQATDKRAVGGVPRVSTLDLHSQGHRTAEGEKEDEEVDEEERRQRLRMEAQEEPVALTQAAARDHQTRDLTALSRREALRLAPGLLPRASCLLAHRPYYTHLFAPLTQQRSHGLNDRSNDVSKDVSNDGGNVDREDGGSGRSSRRALLRQSRRAVQMEDELNLLAMRREAKALRIAARDRTQQHPQVHLEGANEEEHAEEPRGQTWSEEVLAYGVGRIMDELVQQVCLRVLRKNADGSDLAPLEAVQLPLYDPLHETPTLSQNPLVQAQDERDWTQILKTGVKGNFRDQKVTWQAHLSISMQRTFVWNTHEGLSCRYRFSVFDPATAQAYEGIIRDVKHLREVLGVSGRDLLVTPAQAQLAQANTLDVHGNQNKDPYAGLTRREIVKRQQALLDLNYDEDDDAAAKEANDSDRNKRKSRTENEEVSEEEAEGDSEGAHKVASAQAQLQRQREQEMLLFIARQRLELVKNHADSDATSIALTGLPLPRNPSSDASSSSPSPAPASSSMPPYRVEFRADRLFSADKITPVNANAEEDERVNAASEGKLLDIEHARGRKLIRLVRRVSGVLLQLTVFELPTEIAKASMLNGPRVQGYEHLLGLPPPPTTSTTLSPSLSMSLSVEEQTLRTHETQRAGFEEVRPQERRGFAEDRVETTQLVRYLPPALRIVAYDPRSRKKCVAVVVPQAVLEVNERCALCVR